MFWPAHLAQSLSSIFYFFPSVSLRAHSTSLPVQHLTAAVWRHHQPSGGRWYLRGSNREPFHWTTGTDISSSNCQLSLDAHWPVAPPNFLLISRTRRCQVNHRQPSLWFFFLFSCWHRHRWGRESVSHKHEHETAWSSKMHSRHALKHCSQTQVFLGFICRCGITQWLSGEPYFQLSSIRCPSYTDSEPLWTIAGPD